MYDKTKMANTALSVLMGCYPAEINYGGPKPTLVASKYELDIVNGRLKLGPVKYSTPIEDGNENTFLIGKYAKKAQCPELENGTAADCLNHFVESVLNDKGSHFWDAAKNNGYTVEIAKAFLNDHFDRFFKFNEDRKDKQISRDNLNMLEILKKQLGNSNLNETPSEM